MFKSMATYCLVTGMLVASVGLRAETEEKKTEQTTTTTTTQETKTTDAATPEASPDAKTGAVKKETTKKEKKVTKAKPEETAGGLKKKDIKVGAGAAAKDGDVLEVNYIGTLTDGKKFDSSYDRKQTFKFKLGQDAVIQGWHKGLAGMKKGGKRRLTIPPDLGYGANGAGGVIPPNATLIFDVELVDINPKS